MAKPDTGSAGYRRLLLGSLLVAIPLGLLGLARFAQVTQAYEAHELAFTETPQTYRVWLTRAWSEDGPEATEAIRERLLLMPIARRVSAAATMSGNLFWEGIVADPAARLDLMRAQLAATEAALEDLPTAGDLWLLAARLRTVLTGFDQTARTYLAASFQFAPLEGPVIRARTLFALGLVPFFTEDLRRSVSRDIDVLQRWDPRSFGQIADLIPPDLMAP